MFSSLPNNHITKALKQMAKAVYPEEYKDLKMSKNVSHTDALDQYEHALWVLKLEVFRFR